MNRHVSVYLWYDTAAVQLYVVERKHTSGQNRGVCDTYYIMCNARISRTETLAWALAVSSLMS